MAATGREREGQQVECKTPSCHQIVFIVAPSGRVYPKGDNSHIEPDGRLRTTCPVCRQPNRYRPVDAAA